MLVVEKQHAAARSAAATPAAQRVDVPEPPSEP